jgi:hypothetical protein
VKRASVNPWTSWTGQFCRLLLTKFPPAGAVLQGGCQMGSNVAVRAIVANETASISVEEMQRWSKWALAQADRVDPVRSARFIDSFDEKDDAN